MCTLGMFTTIGFAPPVHWSAPISPPPQGGSAGAAPDDIDRIVSMNQHNHGLSEYESNVNEIKRKCKTIAKSSQSNLRQIFDNVTRNDPFASEISFREVESSMYHARRMLQPMIPPTASQFCDMLPTTTFGDSTSFL